MNSLTNNWAITLITDPVRAAQASKKRRQSAWHSLMSARGKRCRYGWRGCGFTNRTNGSGDAA
ncbi:hypothetical protein DL1_11825 [Thioclava dalianensis]|uniref:Uncharacterized protein n=2 Tax=Thioclava dalianensis TaxID=1185766 RepID=A0A074U185_9RHOB|nr:hypothetical protein [Thioclava dalianensis]KEP68427.1 hypothetical protein DL1_11825 [Thioclava dalianensis]SFN62001.1 hypothetical protein SAMN05216224_10829 [Thioclava dalianensis]